MIKKKLSPCCNEKNSYHAKFCAFCGTPLEQIPNWPQAGANTHRSSNYIIPANLEWSLNYCQENDFIPENSSALDFPQPIFADNVFCCWDIQRHHIALIPIEPEDEYNKQVKRVETVPLDRRCTPGYSNSLSFDGTTLCCLNGDQFLRISIFTNQIVGRQITNPLIDTGKLCSPLIINQQNPDGKPSRFWIKGLKNSIIVIDITCLGEEDEVIIPLDAPLTEEDTLYSGLSFNHEIIFLSQTGYLVRIPIDAIKFKLSEIEKQIRIERIVENNICSAPLILGGKLIFQMINIEPTQKNSKGKEWHQVKIGYYSLNTDQLEIYETENLVEKDSYQSTCHIGGIGFDQRNDYVFLKNYDLFNFLVSPVNNPGTVRDIKLKIERREDRPNYENHLYSAGVNDKLLICEKNKMVISLWDIDRAMLRTKENLLQPIKYTDEDLSPYSMPIICGNIVAVMFKKSICFKSI